MEFEQGGSPQYIQFRSATNPFVDRVAGTRNSIDCCQLFPLSDFSTSDANLAGWISDGGGAWLGYSYLPGQDAAWGILRQDHSNWEWGISAGGWTGQGAYYSNSNYAGGWVGVKDHGQAKAGAAHTVPFALLIQQPAVSPSFPPPRPPLPTPPPPKPPLPQCGGIYSALGNVALGQPTGYNTVAGLHGVSGGNADGIIDGLGYASGWSACVHTSDWKTDPYVYVDLGASHTFSKVRLLTAHSGTLPWSSGFILAAAANEFASPADFTAVSTQQCGSTPSVLTGAESWNEFECSSPITGRYVGFLVPGSNKIVSFCEIEVCV